MVHSSVQHAYILHTYVRPGRPLLLCVPLQVAVVTAWEQLAGAALAAHPAAGRPPRSVAARLARRRRQDADWAAAAVRCRLPAAVFTAWRAATRLSRGQAEVEQVGGWMDGLEASAEQACCSSGSNRNLHVHDVGGDLDMWTGNRVLQQLAPRFTSVPPPILYTHTPILPQSVFDTIALAMPLITTSCPAQASTLHRAPCPLSPTPRPAPTCTHIPQPSALTLLSSTPFLHRSKPPLPLKPPPQASAKVEALSAALPAWVAHLGDTRRLERAWLAWRLAAAAATARAAVQRSRRSSRAQQEQGQLPQAQGQQFGVEGQAEGLAPTAAGAQGAGEEMGGAGWGSHAAGAAGKDQAVHMGSSSSGVFAGAGLAGEQQQAEGGGAQPLPGRPTPPKVGTPHHHQQQQAVLGAGGKWSLRRASKGHAAAAGGGGGVGGSVPTAGAATASTSKALFPPQRQQQVLQDTSAAPAPAAATAPAAAGGAGQLQGPPMAMPPVPYGAVSLLRPAAAVLVPATDLTTTTASSSSPRVTAQLAGNLAAITSSLAELQQQVAAHRQYVCRSPGGTVGRQQEQQQQQLEQQVRPPWVDVTADEVQGAGLADGEQLQEGEPETLAGGAGGVGEMRSAVWYAESPRLHAAAAAAGVTEDLVGAQGGPPLTPTSAAASTGGAAAPGEAHEVLCGDKSQPGQEGIGAGGAGAAPSMSSKNGLPTPGRGAARPRHQCAAGTTPAKEPLSRQASRTLASQGSQQHVASVSRQRGTVGKGAGPGGSGKAGPGRSTSAAAKTPGGAAAATGRDAGMEGAAAHSVVKGKTSGPQQQRRQQQQDTEGLSTMAAATATAAAGGRLRSSGQVGDPEAAVSFPLQQLPGSPAAVVPSPHSRSPVAAGSPGPTFLRPAAAGGLGAAAGSVLLHQRVDSSSGGRVGSSVPPPGIKAGQLQAPAAAAAAGNPLARAGWQLLGQPVMVKVDASGGVGGTGLGSSLTGTIGSTATSGSSWRRSGTLGSTSVMGLGQAEEPEVYIAQERPRSATPKPQAWAALPAPYVQQQ
jgi:hypothetical protein